MRAGTDEAGPLLGDSNSEDPTERVAIDGAQQEVSTWFEQGIEGP